MHKFTRQLVVCVGISLAFLVAGITAGDTYSISFAPSGVGGSGIYHSGDLCNDEYNTIAEYPTTQATTTYSVGNLARDPDEPDFVYWCHPDIGIYRSNVSASESEQYQDASKPVKLNDAQDWNDRGCYIAANTCCNDTLYVVANKEESVTRFGVYTLNEDRTSASFLHNVDLSEPLVIYSIEWHPLAQQLLVNAQANGTSNVIAFLDPHTGGVNVVHFAQDHIDSVGVHRCDKDKIYFADHNDNGEPRITLFDATDFGSDVVFESKKVGVYDALYQVADDAGLCDTIFAAQRNEFCSDNIEFGNETSSIMGIEMSKNYLYQLKEFKEYPFGGPIHSLTVANDIKSTTEVSTCPLWDEHSGGGGDDDKDKFPWPLLAGGCALLILIISCVGYHAGVCKKKESAIDYSDLNETYYEPPADQGIDYFHEV